MDKFDRIFKLHQILSSHRQPIARKVLEQRLECTRTTVTRIIELLRNELGAPVVYDRQRNGYLYDRTQRPLYELPGLWFNGAELYALLVSQQLLREVSPGVLQTHIAPLAERIKQLLAHHQAGSGELEKRVRILQMAQRPSDVHTFRQIATALVERKQLRCLYHGRVRDKTTERIISPQRLIYYRDNWLLDVWCHLRGALRTFSLDRLHISETLGEPARDLPEQQLDGELGAGYGIFAGAALHTAVIRFSPQAARWVADEQWHPQQTSRLLDSGGWELHIPYSDPRELIGDILRHGADAEVIAPPQLRAAVAEKLKSAVGIYW